MRFHGRCLVVVAIASAVLLFGNWAPAQTCPELLGRWPYGIATAVAVDGNTAYLGSGTVLLVLDVSTPATPSFLGEVVFPDVVRGVAVQGDYAYVALGYDKIRVVDVANPAAPVEVGDIDTPGYANDLMVASDHLFVADGSHGRSATPPVWSCSTPP